MIRRIALPTYPPTGTGSFCLIDRKVIDALNSFPERNRSDVGTHPARRLPSDDGCA